ncbi:MAG: AAA family ATPase [Gammaproteobacteria bacterium]
MIHTLALANYRSIRVLRVELSQLNLVTGANGCGKSNLYRGLRLLCDVAHGNATPALAREGGLTSVLWAGPETLSGAMKRGEQPVQGGPRVNEVALRLGFVTDSFGYAVDFGLPLPVPRTLFGKDPEIKREAIWHGDSWNARRSLIDRFGPLVRARDEAGSWQVVEQHLPAFDSMLTQVADPALTPEVVALRDELRAWRFYDHFRCDHDSPARRAQIGVRTPVLSNDGHDLAAAWQTVNEIGDGEALARSVDDAFAGATVQVATSDGRFELLFEQPGLLRPLSQAELSDGTLRYLLLIAALATPRPPPIMVLNEPEMSLHPDLLAPLGRLMLRYAQAHPLWVVSHSPGLQNELLSNSQTNHIELVKELGETRVANQGVLDAPAWTWPKRKL